MARRDHENANPILWILFLIALYISSFFMRLPEMEQTGVFGLGLGLNWDFLFARTTLSAVLAAVFLLLTALSLHTFNNRFSSGLNFILPLLYLILAVANPYAIWFTPFHIAALGIVWALRYFVKYKAETGHPTDLFCSFFLLVFSSCFYLPSIWLAPFLLISGFGYMENKLRYLLTVILGLLFGVALIVGLNYLVLGMDALASLPREWLGAMSAIATHLPEFSLLQICREGLLVILVLVAALRNVRNQGKYKISESKMLSDVTLCTIVLFIVTALYLPDYSLPFEVMVFAPASLVIFGLFGDSRKSLVTIFSLFIMVLIVIERALGFIEVDGTPLIESLVFFSR
ncbi:MAG: hypothetical protein J5495_06300, partial [Bacteroidales bacterium]|nr:hypothetical protein [Bacteroidales bacterium]